MEGVCELAEEIFHMPVRIGTPTGVKGLKEIVNNPIYSTGVGLLQFGVQEQARQGFKQTVSQDGNSILDKIKNFFQAGV
jgi:cell division protein FtsA